MEKNEKKFTGSRKSAIVKKLTGLAAVVGTALVVNAENGSDVTGPDELRHEVVRKDIGPDTPNKNSNNGFEKKEVVKAVRETKKTEDVSTSEQIARKYNLPLAEGVEYSLYDGRIVRNDHNGWAIRTVDDLGDFRLDQLTKDQINDFISAVDGGLPEYGVSQRGTREMVVNNESGDNKLAVTVFFEQDGTYTLTSNRLVRTSEDVEMPQQSINVSTIKDIISYIKIEEQLMN